MIVDENFFDVIDNEIKAYLLGFITADGTINDTRKTPILQVHISIKDDYIIKLLEEYIRRIYRMHNKDLLHKLKCSF